MASRDITDRAALAFLVRQAGRARLAWLALLMLGSSLTEGVGLLLLVPITGLVLRQPGEAVRPEWLAPLADQRLALLLAGLVVLVSLRAGIVYATNESRRTLGLELARGIRLMAHRAVLGADWRWLVRRHSADHAALITGEAERVAGLADQGLVIATATVALLVLAGSAALISWPVTLVVLAIGLVAGLLANALRRRTAREGEAYVEAAMALQRQVSNGLQHLRAARIAGAESDLARGFEQASNRLVELEARFLRAGHRILMGTQIAAVIALALLVYGALEIAALPLAVVLPVVAVVARIVPLVSAVQQGLRGWRYGTPALASLLGLIEEAEAAREPPLQPGVAGPALAHALELSGVSLHYSGRARSVLEGFDLTIPAGAMVAVAGPSGSGKSSLADLVAGLIAPDAGEVLVDGKLLDPSLRVGWRRRVAYVEQQPFLFDGSIAENLAWGREGISAEQLWDALDAASAGFVRGLPLALETPLGEAGRQLSGGEKQRIALARALLARPDLLILDEVTAGLDQANRAAIMASLEQLRGKVTVLILSHDPVLLGMADRVIELPGHAG